MTQEPIITKENLAELETLFQELMLNLRPIKEQQAKLARAIKNRGNKTETS